jgi:hypothetical protein
MNDVANEILEQVLHRDTLNLVSDYLDEAGESEPFELPIGSIIKCCKLWIWPFRLAEKPSSYYKVAGFQLPAPSDLEEWIYQPEYDANEEDKDGVKIDSYSMWSWVKIMECVGLCNYEDYGQECKCQKVPSTNWFLHEIRPNGQDEECYFLYSDIIVVKSGDGPNVEIDNTPLYRVCRARIFNYVTLELR